MPPGAFRERRAKGEVVPIPTLPELSMRKFVAVEEPTTNWFEALPATGFMAKVAKGEVVPTPTFPPLFTMKFVAVDEPTTNALISPAKGLMAKRENGLVVPTPTYPLPLVPFMLKEGVDDPLFETIKE